MSVPAHPPTGGRDVVAALRSEGVPEHRRRLPHVQLAYLLLRPGLQAVLLHRLARRLLDLGVPLVPSALSALAYVLTGAQIAPEARIGPEFVIYHPSGVVINRDVEAGARLRLYSGVVLGTRPGGGRVGLPVLGDRVTIGTGAKVLGGVRIGDSAMIGANSVVIEDVPAGHRAVGVPARAQPLSTASPERSRV